MGLFYYAVAVLSGVLVCNAGLTVNDMNTPIRLFDEELYKSVINHEECERQVTYMQRDQTSLLGQFLDAGIRFPRGIFMLNFVDLGNYDQCLGISSEVSDMKIEGKYCSLRIPFDQNFHLPFLDERLTNFTNKKIVRFEGIIQEVQAFAVPFDLDTESLDTENPLSFAEFNLAVCLPKPCTTDEWFRNVLFNLSAIGFQYENVLCRLPNDKPWVPVDYVAIGIFSFLALITVLSTMYDINHIILQKRDPKTANIFYRTFSVYTNTRRLLSFAPNANALQCLDGVRSISMIWVIVGHTFSMYQFNASITDAVMWITSGDAVWVSTGLFTVDSFFLMAGLLLVYTTVGKMTGASLLKRLHLFYINRLLRMFPLLAALVLLEASVFHRVADGPYWYPVADNVQACRTFWWSTLLHIQNYLNPDDICIPHSWYVAIDIQLHIVSPIILYWVLGKSRKAAWTALVSGLLAITVISTIWNFMKDAPSSSLSVIRLGEMAYYMRNYYMLAWTRGAPFFVGMIVGYILNIYKGKTIKLSTGFLIISWVIAMGLITSAFYTSYVILQLDWDNQVADNLFNSFMRIIWSIGLSWIVFACAKGYGGPINWLLSLNLWKLPGRISFAMYLYHYPITFIISAKQITPTHFSMGARIFDFMGIFMLSFILSFFVTVVIDAPFTVLIKLLMEGGKRRPRPTAENGADPSKNGQIKHVKGVNEMDTTVTTLEKNDSTLEKGVIHLEKNRSELDNNSTIDKIEEVGEPLSKNKETS